LLEIPTFHCLGVGKGVDPNDPREENPGMKQNLTKLLLDEIIVDVRAQSRAAIDHGTLQDYCELMQEGQQFPPITVFYDGNEYRVGDGFHRLAAMKMAGIEVTECKVKPGTWRDALLFSIKSNQQHGLPRNNADKRKMVELILQDPEWSVKYSGRKLAKLCGVSHTLVQKINKEIEGTSLMEPAEPDAIQPSPAEPIGSEAVVPGEMTSEGNEPLSTAPVQTAPEEDSAKGGDLTELDSKSNEQDQPVSPAPESVTDLSPEADSALEPTEDVDVEDRDPMEPDQDSQKDDPTQPNSEDSSATITASLDDHPSNPVEVTPLDEGGETQSHLNTYGGHINADLPEVVTSSNAEARKTIAYALAEHLMDHWDTTDMLKVFLKSDAPIGTIGTGEPEVNGDENIDSEVHLNMLAA